MEGAPMIRHWWQPAEGRRHAYDRTTITPGADQMFTALCGTEVTPTASDFSLDGPPSPTCWQCDREIRVRDGWPAEQIPSLAAVEAMP
ncbi:zinc finger protein [Saccharomonospora halophila]|uniref:zinc finger protein n=1 Tax=Saccharomonospora halophila TaxID=129922 RepID=UPI001E3D37EA|nr:zinc finger protein [Saccharomonospora halophila]